MSTASSQGDENGRKDSSEGCSTSSVVGELLERARGAVHVGLPRRLMANDDAIFDADDPRLKEDILQMIIQYLQDEGYTASMMIMQDEANVKINEQVRHQAQFKKMRKAILDGEWQEVERLAAKTPLRDPKHFLYTIYKQQFLEHIGQGDQQKAFTLLHKKLKPQESLASTGAEFKDLCYLLTCKSVQDAPSFRNWEGVTGSRERLVEEFCAMLEYENTRHASTGEMQQQRLVHLLKQAVRYQIEFSRYHPKVCPKVTTLMEDYICFVLPNSLKRTYQGHKNNVKCIDFVGEEGSMLISGSSDNTLRLWDVEDGSCLRVLDGESPHTSRVWDVSCSGSGEHAVSASGDSMLKVWDLREGTKSPCAATISGHVGDVYSVKFHPSNTHVVTGGYDKTVRVWDVRTGVEVKAFTGHSASVSRVIFNPHGNLVISGSKDSTIRFWDLVSGVCVKQYTSHLGEVTSVEMNQSGSLLLSGSKDNSNRMWDVRQGKPICRFKGHQNTSKNFVRASFGPSESLVVGGSEDGLIYIWDAVTGELLQRLGLNNPYRHRGIAYRAIWNSHQSLLASCAHDSTLKTWWYDESQPFIEDDDIKM